MKLAFACPLWELLVFGARSWCQIVTDIPNWYASLLSFWHWRWCGVMGYNPRLSRNNVHSCFNTFVVLIVLTGQLLVDWYVLPRFLPPSRPPVFCPLRPQPVPQLPQPPPITVVGGNRFVDNAFLKAWRTVSVCAKISLMTLWYVSTWVLCATNYAWRWPICSSWDIYSNSVFLLWFLSWRVVPHILNTIVNV